MEITLHWVYIMEVEHELSTFMIAMSGNYLELEYQLGSMKYVVYWLVANFGLPYDFPLSSPPSFKTISKDPCSQDFPGSIDVMRSGSS
jgi:hypothetical protein